VSRLRKRGEYRAIKEQADNKIAALQKNHTSTASPEVRKKLGT
jgi:hypothetical protein